MGALCSGKAENPQGIEIHRGNIRANAVATQPKVNYSIDNNQSDLQNNGNGHLNEKDNLKTKARLELDDKTVKNIQVAQHLGKVQDQTVIANAQNSEDANQKNKQQEE